MTGSGDLDVTGFLDALADPDDPVASSVLAAQTVAAAAALLMMAARSSRVPGASGLAAQAATVRERAVALMASCGVAFGEATERLAGRSVASGQRDDERDWLLGRALRKAAEGPAAVADAAGDIGLLSVAVADVCEPAQLPDVVTACLLAEAAAVASAQLVTVNLVAGADEDLVDTVRRGVELAAQARAAVTAGR